MVWGRASFELTQKALMAGVPMRAAVSAPSSLAADLAEEAGLTLVGFLRGDSMVIYTRPDRIIDVTTGPTADPDAPVAVASASHTSAVDKVVDQ